MRDNYCIRGDYKARGVAETVEETPGTYWSDSRRKSSRQYQYYVYQRAARLLREEFKAEGRVIDIGCGYPWKANRILRPVALSVTVGDQPTLSEIVENDFPMLNFLGVDLDAPNESADRYEPA